MLNFVHNNSEYYLIVILSLISMNNYITIVFFNIQDIVKPEFLPKIIIFKEMSNEIHEIYFESLQIFHFLYNNHMTMFSHFPY